MTDTGPRVLVVDNEAPIRRFLQAILTAHGYVVFECPNGQDVLANVNAHRPDVIILDLGLPDIDGVEVTRLLRQWTQVPIVILSVRGAEDDKILALDAGADDCLGKPFGSGELLARLRVALRRATAAAEPIFSVGDQTIDLVRRVVTVAQREIQLARTEYDLLRALVAHAGKVLTHHQLLRQVWGLGYEQETHMLRVNMSNLRRKVEPDPARPRYIITEPGVGYRLRTELR